MSVDLAVQAVNERLMSTHLGYDDCAVLAAELVQIVRGSLQRCDWCNRAFSRNVNVCGDCHVLSGQVVGDGGRLPALVRTLSQSDNPTADLSEWLRVQDVTLSPETLAVVLACTFEWLTSYTGDVVDDVLLSLAEDMTAHGIAVVRADSDG